MFDKKFFTVVAGVALGTWLGVSVLPSLIPFPGK
jgi:hypothetical protein